LNERGELLLDEFEKLLTPRTRIVGCDVVRMRWARSNPVKTLVTMAIAGNPRVVDGAQAAPHIHADVQDLDCDFYVLSRPQDFCAHRYRYRHASASSGSHAAVSGWRRHDSFGSFEKTIYAELPHKFEGERPT